MREKFLGKTLRSEKLALVGLANEIVMTYQTRGFRLTLRQLFYVMLSRNAIPNTAYKNLGEAISDGRLVGLLDWDAIEDRIRVPRTPPQFDDLADLVRAALAAYRLPRWGGQPYYVELWVEKDALAGVLEPMASRYHVTLMVNRGYSSQSAMYEASKRFIEAEDRGQSCVLLYLGDHDPSGEDMVRDIDDRLRMFGAHVDVAKVALTMAQVREHHLPPNPAKRSDSRAGRYITAHGEASWEVDALPPEVLQQLISEAITAYVDEGMMAEIVEREETDKAALQAAVSRIMAKKGKSDPR